MLGSFAFIEFIQYYFHWENQKKKNCSFASVPYTGRETANVCAALGCRARIEWAPTLSSAIWGWLKLGTSTPCCVCRVKRILTVKEPLPLCMLVEKQWPNGGHTPKPVPARASRKHLQFSRCALGAKQNGQTKPIRTYYINRSLHIQIAIVHNQTNNNNNS